MACTDVRIKNMLSESRKSGALNTQSAWGTGIFWWALRSDFSGSQKFFSSMEFAKMLVAIITQIMSIDVLQSLENIWKCIIKHSLLHCKFHCIQYIWILYTSKTFAFRAGGIFLTITFFFHHKKSKSEEKSKISTYWLSAIGIYCIVAAVFLFTLLDSNIFFSLFDSE